MTTPLNMSMASVPTMPSSMSNVPRTGADFASLLQDAMGHQVLAGRTSVPADTGGASVLPGLSEGTSVEPVMLPWIEGPALSPPLLPLPPQGETLHAEPELTAMGPASVPTVVSVAPLEITPGREHPGQAAPSLLQTDTPASGPGKIQTGQELTPAVPVAVENASAPREPARSVVSIPSASIASAPKVTGVEVGPVGAGLLNDGNQGTTSDTEPASSGSRSTAPNNNGMPPVTQLVTAPQDVEQQQAASGAGVGATPGQGSFPPAPMGVAAPSGPAASVTPPPAVPQPLAAQLHRPLFALATSGAGEQVLTVRVAPEDIGPVTVRAHITGENVRLELFAPTDAGRDALRSILTELRRDLVASGLGGNLDLSARDQPPGSRDADSGAGGRRGQEFTEPKPGRSTQESLVPTPEWDSNNLSLTPAGESGLDITA